MRTLLRTTGPAVLSLLVFQPTAGPADPIVISSGTIAGHVLLSAAQLDIQGSGFSFTGGLEGFLGNAASCTPCTSPVVDLGARLDQFSSGSGTGVIEGVTYPLVYVGFSSGAFTTPTATLTALGSSLVEVPFTFTGVMNGYLEHPLIRPSDALPIFTVNLGGSGQASARFFGLVDDNGMRAYSVFPDSIRYAFTTSESVPEPGTLLLVGSALGGLTLARAASRRGRRMARRASSALNCGLTYRPNANAPLATISSVSGWHSRLWNLNSALNDGFNLQTQGSGSGRGGTCCGDSGGPVFLAPSRPTWSWL